MNSSNLRTLSSNLALSFFRPLISMFNLSIMASLLFSLMRSNDSSMLGGVESALGFFGWLGVAGECIACFTPDSGDSIAAFEQDGTASVACASRHDAEIKRSK